MDERLQQADTLQVIHRDAAGNIKPIFQENQLFMFLINHGLTPKFPKIPYLLGRWQDYKEIKLHGDYQRR
jgi:hypothetical protein